MMVTMKITKHVLESLISNDVCEIPILYHCENIAFGVAEEFRSKICVACWYDCREIFHADYPKPNHIFINHKKHKNTNLIKFLHSIEDLLGLKKPSKVYKTVRKTATLIVLNSFWKDKMRFSLLTLLLRASIYFNISQFSKRLFEVCKYLHDTKNAVNIFFNGRTCYTGDKAQWHKQFKYKTIEECKKMLVKQYII